LFIAEQCLLLFPWDVEPSRCPVMGSCSRGRSAFGSADEDHCNRSATRLKCLLCSKTKNAMRNTGRKSKR
jgi:hypothetical protein